MIRYQPENEALGTVVILDGRVLRALSGYSQTEESRPSRDRGRPPRTGVDSAGDVDSLFSSAARPTGSTGQPDRSSAPVSITELQKIMQEAHREGTDTDASPLGHNGAWHFILIRMAPGADKGRLAAALRKELTDAGLTVQVRDWRGTAGAVALYVYLMQFVLFLGLFMVGGIVLILTMNSLVMSVFERTGEIGTMRAIGAPRGFIRGLFVVETGALTMLSALAGILLGSSRCRPARQGFAAVQQPDPRSPFRRSRIAPVDFGQQYPRVRLGRARAGNRCLGIPGSTGASYPAGARDSDGMRASMTLLIAFRNFTRNGRRFLLLGLAVTRRILFRLYGTKPRGRAFLPDQHAGRTLLRGARHRQQGAGLPRRYDECAAGSLRARCHASMRGCALRRSPIGRISGADGVVYYNGEAVRIRRVIGMDWTTEGRKISELQFVSGKPEDMSDPRRSVDLGGDGAADGRARR